MILCQLLHFLRDMSEIVLNSMTLNTIRYGLEPSSLAPRKALEMGKGAMETGGWVLGPPASSEFRAQPTCFILCFFLGGGGGGGHTLNG